MNLKIPFYLVCLAALAFLIPLSVRHVPLTENEGVYFTVDQERAQGARLYTDVWDHKPPLLFVWASLTRPLRVSNPENARYTLALVHFFNALLIGLLALRLSKEPRLFWAAAFAYLVLALAPVFYMWSFEADLLMLPWLLGAFCLATCEVWWAWFLAGLLWACAFFTKQTALFYLPAFWFLGPKERGRALVAFVLGADAVAVAVLHPFAVQGRATDLWEAVAGYNGDYVRGGWLYLVGDPLQKLVEVGRWLVLPGLVSYGALGLIFLGRDWRLKDLTQNNLATRPFFMAWGLGALASCFASGLLANYYFMAFIPPAALFISPVLAGLGGEALKRRVLGAAVVAPLATGLALACLGNIGMVRLVFPIDRSVSARELGLELKSKTLGRPGRRLFAWASDPELYAYSGLRICAARSLFLHHLYSREDLLPDLERSLQQKPPDYLIVSKASDIPEPPDWLHKLIQTDYKERPQAEADQFTLYVLRSP